jgi:hypothetical protein
MMEILSSQLESSPMARCPRPMAKDQNKKRTVKTNKPKLTQ